MTAFVAKASLFLPLYQRRLQGKDRKSEKGGREEVNTFPFLGIEGFLFVFVLFWEMQVVNLRWKMFLVPLNLKEML